MKKGFSQITRFRSNSRWQMLILAVFIGILMFGVVGCGNDTETVDGNGEKIIFADYSWDSSQIHNRIASFIVENGYGYSVDYVFGETLVLFQGLVKGDVDVSMETWQENILETYEKGIESGKVKNLGSNFPDAPQGWYVPTYLIKGDPERGIKPLAPDLKSVADLPKYWELFKDPEDPNKGRFYNGPTGWKATEINEEKIKAYGLDKHYKVLSTGSDSALSASLVSAYEKGKPWFGYSWEPTWIMGKLDMTMLEEPEYDKNLWEENYACAYEPAKVTIDINSDLESRAPEVVSFLKNYETTLDQTNKALAIFEKEEETQAAAIWFLKEYPEQWKEWVPEDVATKVEKALNEVK